MIDRGTFIICLIKLFGLQIILTGIFFAIFMDAPIYAVILSVGSLVFAIGSNALLAYILLFRRQTKRG